jgi:hypothetical protein
MTSKVDICNVGLSTYLGEGPINSLTENTPAAVQCNLHYDRLLKSLLMKHWWTFAEGQQVLAEMTNDRTEWNYKYARPADAITIRWVNEATAAKDLIALNQSPDTPRKVVLNAIYSDTASASCSYTKVVDDPAFYPQTFADALSAHIAAATAMAITQNGRLAREAMQSAMYLTDVAMAHDGREEPNEDYAQMATWLTARGVT